MYTDWHAYNALNSIVASLGLASRGWSIKDCTAKTNAGALDMLPTSVFSMHGGHIANCSCTELGGAVWHASGRRVFHNTLLSDCRGGQGGAIVDNFGGLMILGNVTIRGCTASTQGGGVYLNDGSLHVEGCVIEQCRSNGVTSAASLGGSGGLFNDAGSLVVSATRFVECDAPVGSGGSIFVGPNVISTRIIGCYLMNCSAGLDAGGLAAYGATFVSAGTQLISCRAKRCGGGIHVRNANVEVHDSDLISCMAFSTQAGFGGGGGIFAELERTHQVQVVRCRIHKCTSRRIEMSRSTVGARQVLAGDVDCNTYFRNTGGGLRISGPGFTNVSDTNVSEAAAYAGSAIWVAEGAKLDLVRCRLVSNAACSHAAGLMISQGNVKISES
jgi:large repetitive protein